MGLSVTVHYFQEIEAWMKEHGLSLGKAILYTICEELGGITNSQYLDADQEIKFNVQDPVPSLWLSILSDLYCRPYCLIYIVLAMEA